MNPSNTTIVVCRYKEDTAWTQRLTSRGYRVCLYEKNTNPNNPYNLPANVGNEALAYIKYICDYYDSLTPYTIFLQGSDKAWHHEGSVVDIIESMQSKRHKYTSLNKACLGNIRNPMFHQTAWFFDKFLAPYIGPREVHGDWTPGNVCCAQFIVHSSRILRHPRKFYTDIYEWMLTSKKFTPKQQGHVLEWTWFLIFDNPIEKIKNDKKALASYLKKRELIAKKGESATCKKIVNV